MRLYQAGGLLTGAHGELIAQAVAARVDTIEHCPFAGPDRKYGSDFDPAVVDEIAAAGIYVCPAMNVHALTMRDRFSDALDKVIMGLDCGGALAAPAGPGPR